MFASLDACNGRYIGLMLNRVLLKGSSKCRVMQHMVPMQHVAGELLWMLLVQLCVVPDALHMLAGRT